MLLRPMASLVFLFAALGLGLGLAPSADEPDEEKAHAATSLEMSRVRTRAYRIRPIGDGPDFVLRGEPVLNWSSPVYGSLHGQVFLWTSKGRPEVVASFSKWYQPYKHVTDEFHSLATGGIKADLDGQPCWIAEKPGLTLEPLLDAPEPASTPAARLRQIRELAKEFSGREVDRKNEDRDLRLLTQPLYRYEAPEGDVVDGALFALAQGTDPDAILMLEARRVGEAARWHFALVRMSSSAIRVNYKGREVWNVPLIDYAQVYSHREPYTHFRFDDARANPSKKAESP